MFNKTHIFFFLLSIVILLFVVLYNMTTKYVCSTIKQCLVKFVQVAYLLSCFLV